MSDHPISSGSLSTGSTAKLTLGVFQAAILASTMFSAPITPAQTIRTSQSVPSPASYRFGGVSATFGQISASPLEDGHDHMFSDGLFEAVASLYSRLLNDQEPLEKDFEKVLHDNLWNLYVDV